MIHRSGAALSKGDTLNERVRAAKPLIKITPAPKQLASRAHVIVCVISLYFWQRRLVSYVSILVFKSLSYISNMRNQM